MDVAGYFAHTLATAGVPFVAGLPGTTVLAPLEAMRVRGVPFVATRHEQSAVHMADAVGRVSGKAGVALVDIGPGLANTASAVLAAHRDSSPVVLVAGTERRDLLGREVWHEMADVEAFGPLTRRASRVTEPAAFPAELAATVDLATSGRPGPALLSVPTDLWGEALGTVGAPPSLAVPAERPGVPPDALEEAVRLLLGARRPLLLLGGGVLRSGAATEATALAERWDLPVATSPNGRGAVSETHPCCAGVAGRFGNRVASRLLAEADVVLAIGCRLSDLTTDGWALLDRDARVIHVDTDAGEIGRNWPAAVGVVADARTALADLLRALPGLPAGSWSAGRLTGPRRVERAAFLALREVGRVLPQHVVGSLLAHAPGQHRVLMGSGRHQQFVGEWPVERPGQLLYAAHSGAMGFALPAAIASSLLDPGTAALCCVGDGDFLMSSHELETAVRTGAAVKVVVLDDSAYGAILERQRHPYGTELTTPDLAGLAAAYGVPGRVVAGAGEVDDAAAWLWRQPGPALLAVALDRRERRTLLHGHDIGEPFAPPGQPGEPVASTVSPRSRE